MKYKLTITAFKNNKITFQDTLNIGSLRALVLWIDEAEQHGVRFMDADGRYLDENMNLKRSIICGFRRVGDEYTDYEIVESEE